MKRINKLLILGTILLCLNPLNVEAKDKVKFESCVDGDTIKVTLNNEVKTVRFLAVDTPETKHPTKGEQPYGKEASTYTCDKVTNAKKIELEYDSNSDKEDKYGRLLAWIWVDGSLLQKELVTNGLARVAYLYGDYKYTEELQGLEKVAQSKELGLWSVEGSTQTDPTETTITEQIIEYLGPTFVVFIILIIIIIILLVPKYRNKAIKKIKKEATKDIKKYIDKKLK